MDGHRPGITSGAEDKHALARLETLDGTGLDDEDKLRVIGLLSSYTLSEASMAHDAARAAQQAQVPGAGEELGLPWDFRALLRELVDERAYPHLHRIAWDGRPEVSEHEEFSFGVERILDGVQALMDKDRRD